MTSGIDVLPVQRGGVDLGRGEVDSRLARTGTDAFDLAAVTGTVEGHGDMGDAGGHEAIEEAVFVARAQGEDPGGAFGMRGKDRPEIDGGRPQRGGQSGREG